MAAMQGRERRVPCSFGDSCRARSYQDAPETSDMPMGLSPSAAADTSFEGHDGFLEKASRLPFVA